MTHQLLFGTSPGGNASVLCWTLGSLLVTWPKYCRGLGPFGWWQVELVGGALYWTPGDHIAQAWILLSLCSLLWGSCGGPAVPVYGWYQVFHAGRRLSFLFSFGPWFFSILSALCNIIHFSKHSPVHKCLLTLTCICASIIKQQLVVWKLYKLVMSVKQEGIGAHF